MNRSTTTKEERKALWRLAALLLALADRAERAGGRSGPVRYLALWFLRPGETVARDYVCGLTGCAACGPASIALSIADDAGRLAASFRALAMALAAFAATPGTGRATGIGQAVDAVLVTIVTLAAFTARPTAVERLDSS